MCVCVCVFVCVGWNVGAPRGIAHCTLRKSRRSAHDLFSGSWLGVGMGVWGQCRATSTRRSFFFYFDGRLFLWKQSEVPPGNTCLLIHRTPFANNIIDGKSAIRPARPNAIRGTQVHRQVSEPIKGFGCPLSVNSASGKVPPLYFRGRPSRIRHG